MPLFLIHISFRNEEKLILYSGAHQFLVSFQGKVAKMYIQFFRVRPTVRIKQLDKYFHQIFQWLVLRNCVDPCQVWLK